ncbi:MAG: methionyl-tRNA formyltransferase [Candidatus Peregrinibacteria bacterium]|nr:methionyl-tRNA formyltransferase [Candidatus Peregrinibacteria bacterium]
MKHKILFFGTPEIAVPSLKTLANSENVEIVGVGVFPDRPVGRKKIMKKCPVKIAAENLNLKTLEVSNKNDLEKIYSETDFDLAIVIAFGIIFPESILQDGKFINIHFSLLPEYRGASPVQSAILNRDKTSGITWQKMVKRLDAGDVLFQKKYEIENKSTSELWNFFAQETANSMPEFITEYFSNKLLPLPQNDNQATFCGKFTKQDGEIFPNKETAEQIYQKFLAFNVWPGIFLHTKKGNMKLTDISLEESTSSKEITCKNDTKLFINRAQLFGKTEMSICDIIRGNPEII